MESPMCYFYVNNTLSSASTFQFCNPGPSCCNLGDFCLPDAFCYTTNQNPKTTGYYMSSCSEDSFPSPNCSTHCGRWPSQDVVYDSSSQLWACCFNPTENTVDCTDPGNETFEAPAPSSLVVFEGATASATVAAVIPAPISTSSFPTPSRATESSASLQPTSSSSQPEASSSSIIPDSCKYPSQRGIDIGFGIGIGALGSVIITGAIAYRFSRWRVYRKADWRANWGDSDLWGGYDPRGNGPWDGNGYWRRNKRMPTRVTERYPIYRTRRAGSPPRFERQHPTMSYERVARPLRTERERIIVPASPINVREDADRPIQSDREHPIHRSDRQQVRRQMREPSAPQRRIPISE